MKKEKKPLKSIKKGGKGLSVTKYSQPKGKGKGKMMTESDRQRLLMQH